jgi:hypothetical protein
MADVSNLLSGPGVLYRAAFGATEPADTDINTVPSSGTWTDCGGTMDGVTISINQEFFEIEIDQTVDVAGRRLTKRDIQLSTNLAEATLENLAFMTNAGASITTGTGFKSLEPANDTTATQLTYSALLFDGFAPGDGKTRRVIARRMLSTDNVELAYKKGELTVLTATFSAHYVSASIPPYKIVDES